MVLKMKSIITTTIILASFIPIIYGLIIYYYKNLFNTSINKEVEENKGAMTKDKVVKYAKHVRQDLILSKVMQAVEQK